MTYANCLFYPTISPKLQIYSVYYQITYFVFFSHIDKSSVLLGRGRRKKITSLKVTDQTDGTEGSISDNAVSDKNVYKVNQEGRYICQLCEKTFKTVCHTFHLCVRLFIEIC